MVHQEPNFIYRHAVKAEVLVSPWVPSRASLGKQMRAVSSSKCCCLWREKDPKVLKAWAFALVLDLRVYGAGTGGLPNSHALHL